MNQNIRKYRRTTVVLSYATLLIGIIYIFVVGYGLITGDEVTGNINDRIRVVMEILTLFSSLVLLLLSVTIHYMTDKSKQIFTMLGILFMMACFIVTCSVHFLSITVSDSLIHSNPSFESLLSLGWPSVLMALDILAWDIFFGLAALCIGFVFITEKRGKVTGILFILSGLLSIIGIIAVPLHNMNIRFIGIFGYTILPVIACMFLISYTNKLEKIDHY